MDFQEAFDSTAFWLLSAGGIVAVLLGYIVTKRSGMISLPVWQLILTMVVIVIASAFFVTKD